MVDTQFVVSYVECFLKKQYEPEGERCEFLKGKTVLYVEINLGEAKGTKTDLAKEIKSELRVLQEEMASILKPLEVEVNTGPDRSVTNLK